MSLNHLVARNLLFQPRRWAITDHPGLEGVQGEEGVKKPQFENPTENFPSCQASAGFFYGSSAGWPEIRRYLNTLLRTDADRNFLFRQGAATGRQAGVSGGLGGERGGKRCLGSGRGPVAWC